MEGNRDNAMENLVIKERKEGTISELREIADMGIGDDAEKENLSSHQLTNNGPSLASHLLQQRAETRLFVLEIPRAWLYKRSSDFGGRTAHHGRIAGRVEIRPKAKTRCPFNRLGSPPSYLFALAALLCLDACQCAAPMRRCVRDRPERVCKRILCFLTVARRTRRRLAASRLELRLCS